MCCLRWLLFLFMEIALGGLSVCDSSSRPSGKGVFVPSLFSAKAPPDQVTSEHKQISYFIFKPHKPTGHGKSYHLLHPHSKSIDHKKWHWHPKHGHIHGMDYGSGHGYGMGHGHKGYHKAYKSGFKKGDGYKGGKGFKDIKGLKKLSHGDHGKWNHKGLHDQHGKKYKGLKHKNKYYGDLHTGHKGQKGHKYGTKGHHNKGHKDKGFKNVYHKEEFHHNKKFYDDYDNKKYHDKYDDFDSYAKGHKGTDYKGGHYKGGYHNDKYSSTDEKDIGEYHDNDFKLKDAYADKKYYGDDHKHGHKEGYKGGHSSGHKESFGHEYHKDPHHDDHHKFNEHDKHHEHEVHWKNDHHHHDPHHGWHHEHKDSYEGAHDSSHKKSGKEDHHLYTDSQHGSHSKQSEVRTPIYSDRHKSVAVVRPPPDFDPYTGTSKSSPKKTSLQPKNRASSYSSGVQKRPVSVKPRGPVNKVSNPSYNNKPSKAEVYSKPPSNKYPPLVPQIAPISSPKLQRKESERTQSRPRPSVFPSIPPPQFKSISPRLPLKKEQNKPPTYKPKYKSVFRPQQNSKQSTSSRSKPQAYSPPSGRLYRPLQKPNPTYPQPPQAKKMSHPSTYTSSTDSKTQQSIGFPQVDFENFGNFGKLS